MSRRDEPKATVTPEVEAESWAVELESWALVREKVVGKLDIAQAREARRLATEIRAISCEAKDARLSDDNACAGILLETLGSPRSRALTLLSPR